MIEWLSLFTPCGVPEVYGPWESCPLAYLHFWTKSGWVEWGIPRLPSAQVAGGRDVRFRNISLASADCFVELVWSDSRRKLPPLAHSFFPSSSYGSHYLEWFLMSWEMFKLICFDWKMNFSYRVFQRIFFFFWGWSQILLLLILRYQLGSKVLLLF